MRGCAAVLATLCLSLASCAGGRHKGPPLSAAIDETAYRHHVRVLASDEFDGRRPGTIGEDKTVAYLVDQFRKLGLKPGNGESFVQQVPLVEIVTQPDASLSISGRNGRHELKIGKDAVIWSKRTAPQVQLRHSALVFVGYGIVAPEYTWNDYAGIDVHGKTVVVLVNDPGYGGKDPKLFKGNAMSIYGRWAYKIEEATRHGADGVLLIHDTDTAGFGWNVVQSTWTGPQLELANAASATSAGSAASVASEAGRGDTAGVAGHAAVEGWISNSAARALFADAGLNFVSLTASAAHAGFKPVEMGLSVDATLHDSVREFNSANVIALLPGAGRRREYVLYAAHWDGLGQDSTRAGHNVFNGAVDNASGVAGLLVLAQSFSRTRPAAARSIVFLATTGAQPGLLGSQYYVEHPIFPLRDTAAVIDLDTLHGGGPTRDVSVLEYGNTDLEETVRAVALLQGREMRPEPTPQQGLYFSSDSFSFANAGVPALYVKGGIDDTARGPIWGQAQLDDYTAHRYRQPSDQYAADWDVRGTLEDLSLYYDVGNRLAHSRRFPRWYPNSEFRVARDRAREP